MPLKSGLTRAPGSTRQLATETLHHRTEETWGVSKPGSAKGRSVCWLSLLAGVRRGQLNARTLLPKAGTARERGKSDFLRSMHRKSMSGRWREGCWGGCLPSLPTGHVCVGVTSQHPVFSLLQRPDVSSCLQYLQQGNGKLPNGIGKRSVEAVSLSHAVRARSFTRLFGWLIFFFPPCSAFSAAASLCSAWAGADFEHLGRHPEFNRDASLSEPICHELPGAGLIPRAHTVAPFSL